ncbi:MAG: hypothetical protein ACLGGU_03065 [Gammaproteobacteria bacterium]
MGRNAPDENEDGDWRIMKAALVKVTSHPAQCPSVIALYTGYGKLLE